MFCAVVGALASAVFALLARSHTMCCPTTNNYYSKFPTRAADPQGASKHLPTLEDVVVYFEFLAGESGDMPPFEPVVA